MSPENRCTASTEFGTRCLRRVAQAEGYCWQHLKLAQELDEIFKRSGLPQPVVVIL